MEIKNAISKETATKMKLLKVTEDVQKSIDKRKGRCSVNESFQDENALIEMILTKGYKLSSKAYAELLNEKYDRDLNVSDIENLLRKIILFRLEIREELSVWANKMVDLLREALAGKKKSYEDFKKLMKDHKYYEKIYPNFYSKLIVVGIYNKLEPFKSKEENKKIIYNFGNTWAAYHLDEMLASIEENYKYGTRRKRHNRNKYQNKTRNSKDQRIIEELEDQLAFQKAKLKRAEDMLNDLQEEFDKLLEESKDVEKVKFFSQLNSKKYGNILDQLVKNNNGVNKLRREKVELPLELNGVLIIFKNMLKFIKYSEIEPMLKPGMIKEVSCKDIDTYEYEGSPFADEESKKVKVVSPGWIYKKENIQIARPIIQEVMEEEVNDEQE